MPPGEPLLAFTEAGEVAAAGCAPVRRGAQAQQNPRPAGRVIVLLAPGSEFLAIAAPAARIFPCAVLPNAGFPACVATTAPQWILADQSKKLLLNPVAVRNAYIASVAPRASKPHSSDPESIIANLQLAGTGFRRAAVYASTRDEKACCSRSRMARPEPMCRPSIDVTGRSSRVVEVMNTSSADSRS
jgi:hypothetical protein